MRAPKIGTLFAILFVLVLALPIAAVGVAHVYENQLVRNTEEVLLAEAVVVGEVYRRSLDPVAAVTSLAEPEDPGAPRFAPFTPRLDIRSSPLLPRAARETATSSSALVGRELGPLLERAAVRTLSGVRVLDTRGLVVASSIGKTGYSLAPLPEVQAALRGDYAPALRQRFSDSPAPPLSSLSRTANVRVSLAIPIFRDPRAAPGSGAEVIGVVYTSRTPLDTTKALWLVRDELVGPVAVSLSLTLAITLFLTLTISRPIVRLRDAAESVARGERDGRLDVGALAPRELHALSASLAKMRGQLEARAEYIREFAANAAHELKTPLTSLRGASELLLEEWGEMSAEQRAKFLSNIHDDAVRMDGLVQRILQLARIESSRPETEPLDLAAFLEGTVERYRRRGAALALSFEADDRIVAMAPEQLDALVTNLVDNAVRHGAGRAVELAVRDEREGRVLSVRDHGPPLPEAHFARIFERFYSTERGRGGTGLGLAIVRAIAEAHGGRVSVERHVEGGATFRVVLDPRRAHAEP
jgi:signal transduction histidine kinase